MNKSTCKKCGFQRYCFPSCGYVEPIPGSNGGLELVQCIFIDHLLLNGIAQISPSGELTLQVELDIIPAALKEMMSILCEQGMTQEKFAPVLERYKEYIKQLTAELMESFIKPRRAAYRAAKAQANELQASSAK
jgi:hypothetical protein